MMEGKMKWLPVVFLTALLALVLLPATVRADSLKGKNYDGPGDASSATVKPSITLTQKTIDRSQVSDLITIELKVDNASNKYCKTGFYVKYDQRLQLIPNRDEKPATQGSAGSGLLAIIEKVGDDGLYLSTGGSYDYGMNGTLWSMDFEVPSNAAPGDKYPIEFYYIGTPRGQVNTFLDVNNDNNMQAYVFTQGLTHGYIQIRKENATVRTEPASKDLTYCASAQELVTEGEADGGTMQYAVSDNNSTAPSTGWSEEVPKGTDAKAYYVWYKVVGDSGHNNSQPAWVAAGINKKELTITANDQTYVYDGQIHGESDTTYADPAKIAQKVTVQGLQGDDALTSVILDGQEQEVGEYTIEPSNATVGDATDNYEIHYVLGKLTIKRENEPHKVTVTDDGNGTGKASLTRAKKGEEITLSATAKGGYCFKKWEVVSGGISITDDKFSMPDNDVTVKAIFEPVPPDEHTITVTNDGNGTATADKTSAVKGSSVKLTADPNENCKFKEWQVISGDINIKDDEFTMPDEDVEIKAVFIKKDPGPVTEYTITFEANGGKGEMDPQHGDQGEEIRLSKNTFTHEGYTFKEWNTKEDGSGTSYEDKATLTLEGDMKLYAQWKEGKKKSSNGDEEEEEDRGPAAVNPDTVEGYFLVNKVPVPGVVMGKAKQGVAAQSILDKKRPTGYTQAFSFNMAINGKFDQSLKNGELTIIIPKEYLKAGRTFAIMALDKNGNAFVFDDTDTNPATVTANISFEGYAFALIYKD